MKEGTKRGNEKMEKEDRGGGWRARIQWEDGGDGGRRERFWQVRGRGST